MSAQLSAASGVGEEEMRFFQLRARQLMLQQREDLAWKKLSSDTSCSCQPLSSEVVVQVKGTPIGRGKPSSVQTEGLPRALSEIKAKLERIDLALSGRAASLRGSKAPGEEVLETRLPTRVIQDEALQNPENARRVALVESCLKQSVARLQSAAQRKKCATHPFPKSENRKSRGYFLPHQLQEQRAAARHAYLASLSKSKSSNLQPPASVFRGKKPGAQVGCQRRKAHKSSAINTNRTKNNLTLNPKEMGKEHQVSNQVFEDQKIETALDGIMDDLMGETVLLLNRIKQAKKEKVHEKPTSKTSPTLPDCDNHLKATNNASRIGQSVFSCEGSTGDDLVIRAPSHSCLDVNQKTTLSPNTQSKSKELEVSTSKQETETSLFVHASTTKEIQRYRKDFANYMERVGRPKREHFGSFMLANIISEFLLDESLEAVAQELLDVPGLIITDLYNQEFWKTL